MRDPFGPRILWLLSEFKNSIQSCFRRLVGGTGLRSVADHIDLFSESTGNFFQSSASVDFLIVAEAEEERIVVADFTADVLKFIY